MVESIETEIRKALDAKAHELEVPSDLATRTMEHARGSGRPSLRERMRSRRDARRMRLSVSGYPRWMYVGGALATAVLLFVVGFYVTTPRRGAEDVASGRIEQDTSNFSVDPMSGGGSEKSSEDAVAGSRVGVVSSGDSSVDATNRSEDVDIDTGDATPEDAVALNSEAETGESSFAGLTAGGEQRVPASELRAPKLVRSADIQVAVRDFGPAWERANEIASDHDGFVIDSQTTQVSDEMARGTVRMRVPASSLPDALEDLRGLGTLARLDTSADDISAQLDDTKTRIKKAQEEEAELTELLNRAATVSEELEVRDRLESLRKNIRSLKERQKAQQDEVNFSTVEATIIEDEAAAGRGSTIVGRAAGTSGRVALTILAGILVIAGALVPLGILAVAGWFIARKLRRRRSA